MRVCVKHAAALCAVLGFMATGEASAQDSDGPDGDMSAEAQMTPEGGTVSDGMSDEKLPADIYTRVTELSERGNVAAEAGEYRASIDLFVEAFELLPAPASQWNASTWLLAGIVDGYFMRGEYGKARGLLDQLFLYPDALGNPFLHLRAGQIHFELDELDRAADHLMRAYMGYGEDVFTDEDPKYRKFLATRAKL